MGASEESRPDRLAFVVEREAQRLLAEEQLRPDPALVAAGWERRFVADAKRAKEAADLYEELGYEVRSESVRPEHLHADCEDCGLVAMMRFQMIYTRKRKGVGR